MKHLNTIKFAAFTFIASLLLSACSTSNEFSKQKYTNFKHSKHGINLASKPDYSSPVAIKAITPAASTTINEPAVNQPASVNLPVVTQEVKPAVLTTKANRKTLAVVTDKKPVMHMGKFATYKAFKATASALKKGSSTTAGDVDLVILVILAIFIPPLAVYLKEGATSRFVLDLILALIGVVGWWIFPFAGLAYLAAIIYALIIVLGR